MFGLLDGPDTVGLLSVPAGRPYSSDSRCLSVNGELGRAVQETISPLDCMQGQTAAVIDHGSNLMKWCRLQTRLITVQ